jgi:putative transcriptional regulator
MFVPAVVQFYNLPLTIKDMKSKKLIKDLGVRIRQLRTKKGWTQNQLAEACSFQKASMSKIESGQSNPTVRTLYKISKAMDVPIRDLFKN